MQDSYRLFWAVNLPPDVKATLARLQARLHHPGLNAKWVEQENLHLTLKFLGDTGISLVSAMVGAVRQRVTGSGAFSLKFTGCGTFGRPPRVLWVGVQGDTARLRSIQMRVDAACRELGFEPEKKGYAPHLTIARLREGGLPQGVAAAAAAVGTLATVRVVDIHLVRSVLTPRGPHYTVLDSIEL